MEHDSTGIDFSLLSRCVDGELNSEEEQELQRSLAANPEARKQLTRVAQVTQKILAALSDVSFEQQLHPRVFSSTCAASEDIAAYASGTCTPWEKEKLASHLSSCNACLGEVIEVRRLSAFLTKEPDLPVPPAFVAEVETLWDVPVSRIAIRIVKRGLQLVKHHLTTPFFDLQLEPAMLTRGDETGQRQVVLDWTMEAEQAVIRVNVVYTSDGAALTLTFLTPDRTALEGERITVSQEERTVFSARTEMDGKVYVPHLRPGVYEVAGRDLRLAFQIEITAE